MVFYYGTVQDRVIICTVYFREYNLVTLLKS